MLRFVFNCEYMARKKDPALTLPAPPKRKVQETFRTTKEEHQRLVKAAVAEGQRSMSAYYRTKLLAGLPADV